MAVSLKVSMVERIGRSGFAVGCEDARGLTELMEFTSRRQAKDALQNILDDDAVRQLLRAILIARGLRATADSDDEDDLDLLKGQTITFSPKAAANIVRIV